MSNDLNITHSLSLSPFNVTLHPPAALAISSAQLVTNRQSADPIILSLEAGWAPLRISEWKYFVTTAGLSKLCTTLWNIPVFILNTVLVWNQNVRRAGSTTVANEMSEWNIYTQNNVQNTNTCTLCSTLYYSNVLISLNYIKIYWYSDMFRSQKTIFREYNCTMLSSWII